MKKMIFLMLTVIGVGVSIYFTHEKISPEEEKTGVTSENLLKGIRIQQIGWNGEYWLIATVNSPFGGSNGLVRYDGYSITDLSKKFQECLSG
ncbi:MAG TPA: hypothetical protein ENG20_02070 [Methanomicrobia archaeon]|nr:hypothetical protein [Methanomicrobia archaeon]